MSVPSEDGAYGEDHPLDPLGIELPASVDGEAAEERGEISPRSARASIVGDQVLPNDELEIQQVDILEGENRPPAQGEVAQAENAGNANEHGEEPPHNFRQGQRNSGGSAVLPQINPSPTPPGSTFQIGRAHV